LPLRFSTTDSDLTLMQAELHTVKELAGLLKRATSYVYAMRAQGFRMPGGRATLAQALQWLEENPNPRRKIATSENGIE